MSFFSAEVLRSITNGRWRQRPETPLTPVGLGTDTRADLSGRAFLALRGERYDANEHLAEAVAAGAVMLIADRGEVPVPAGVPCLEVDDGRLALGRIARAHRRTLESTRVIAITGSCGKTTTKRLIHSVLRRALAGTAAPRSFNNDVGVPLSILAASPDDQYLVLEIGTNAPGEVATLASIAEASVAVVTGIGPAHLAGFGSVEAIAREKGALLAHLPADGLAVVNAASHELDGLLRRLNAVVRYGDDPAADLRLTDRGRDAEGWWFEVNGRRRYRIGLPGRHNAINALAAIAVGRRLGLDEDDIAAGLAAADAPPMRMTHVRVAGLDLYNDAYNANPRSMEAALETFLELAETATRRVLILGDMGELGDAADEHHRALGRRLAGEADRLDRIVLIGALAPQIGVGIAAAGRRIPVTHHATLDAATRVSIRRDLRPGDAVLLKASRSLALERLAEDLADHGLAAAAAV
ncbi:MAG: UDP-N-acetylmuramoyl-tripeptide--D-alanyl-D-alanine ligase [Phycisphaerae bacterium]|nr:UDP-N-acetylmuramoyl-tripeptide--D-alanyl-D-alanine ligase [Phycisphaerae bacterium]NNF41661.1 UDP-N-acetylmuramoyl-tripeptide--D-alanyl-D-alanine ligase [Phycisphaerales bacterium]